MATKQLIAAVFIATAKPNDEVKADRLGPSTSGNPVTARCQEGAGG